MPIYKFNRNDVQTNTLKTYPAVRYVIGGTGDGIGAYYNNTPNISGSFTGSIRCTSPRDVSLFELNIDRQEGDFGYITEFRNVALGNIEPLKSVKNTGLIYQFMVKDATRLAFGSVTSKAFTEGQLGEVFTGSYPYTARITKNYYSSTLARFTSPIVVETENHGLNVQSSGSVTQLRALKNTFNHYIYLSPHYAYSSSIFERSFDSVDVGLVNVPSIFYGSRIKPGSVQLDFYVTGTLVGRLEDPNQNGELIQVGPYGSNGSGSVAGVALYSEGFLALTGTWDMTAAGTRFQPSHVESYETAFSYPAWVNFAQSLSGTVTSPNSAFIINMSGTTTTQTLTMFATAPKAELNQSNNPTFVDYYTGSFGVTSSQGYVQNRFLGIKNVVSSAYNTPTASFDRTTYISKIGIYDNSMNLIAIAKPATPIKKTATRDFTFKIELDV
tara:strand:+ start:15746 stop:17068 length:1323 start_codon:yes stop_codon:yes gene_type:complete